MLAKHGENDLYMLVQFVVSNCGGLENGILFVECKRNLRILLCLLRYFNGHVTFNSQWLQLNLC